jgi:hypothetical protein
VTVLRLAVPGGEPRGAEARVAREAGGFGWCIRAPMESEGEHALGHEA